MPAVARITFRSISQFQVMDLVEVAVVGGHIAGQGLCLQVGGGIDGDGNTLIQGNFHSPIHDLSVDSLDLLQALGGGAGLMQLVDHVLSVRTQHVAHGDDAHALAVQGSHNRGLAFAAELIQLLGNSGGDLEALTSQVLLAANASLLNNFEIVATSLIAFFVFKEALSKRLTIAIVLVTIARITLSFEGEGSFQFNAGSLLVLCAACCWGLENNCTRMLSSKSSVQITTLKGIFSGLGSLMIALCIGETVPGILWILAAMVLGFVAYGLSINFYIQAQKDLGAAKTSAYYSIAPFLGVAFSFLLFAEHPGLQFFAGLGIMVIATVLMVKDTISLQHDHDYVHYHTHEHSHDGVIHTHEHSHAHSHNHIHGEDEAAHSHDHGDNIPHTHDH